MEIDRRTKNVWEIDNIIAKETEENAIFIIN